LESFNPQDGENIEVSLPKRVRPAPLSYVAAVTPETDKVNKPTPLIPTATTVSSLTSPDIDLLYEKMKHHISSDYGDYPTVKIDDLETQVKTSSQEIKIITKQLEDTVSTMSLAIQQQNSLGTVHRQTKYYHTRNAERFP
jgi:hypothetical protein